MSLGFHCEQAGFYHQTEHCLSMLVNKEGVDVVCVPGANAVTDIE